MPLPDVSKLFTTGKKSKPKQFVPLDEDQKNELLQQHKQKPLTHRLTLTVEKIRWRQGFDWNSKEIELTADNFYLEKIDPNYNKYNAIIKLDDRQSINIPNCYVEGRDRIIINTETALYLTDPKNLPRTIEVRLNSTSDTRINKITNTTLYLTEYTITDDGLSTTQVDLNGIDPPPTLSDT